MRLCFGTFARVLNCCRQNIIQSQLIARVVMCIDPQNSSIISNWSKVKKQLEDSGIITEEFECNEPAISKLLSCRKNFIFSDGENADIPTQSIVINRFETLVSPFIDSDKKAKVILGLLDIIQKDECLDSETKENFKKYLGMDKKRLLRQREFIFSGFLGQVLLYTVCGKVDNRVGAGYVKTITPDYIDNATEPYMYDCHWDAFTQTLTLSFVEMYDILKQAMRSYQVGAFIEKIDPTVKLDIRWVEKCEGFLGFIKDRICIPFGQDSANTKGKTLQMIEQLAQTLDEYTQYLGVHMRPIAEDIETMVPIYRDEKLEWYMDFIEKSNHYRQKICSICQEISLHVSRHICLEES